MITVQNNTIRVTVTPEIWSAYTAKAQRLVRRQVLPSGDVVEHTPDEIRRGLILSEAMSKLGNASELERIDSEPDTAEITRAAQLRLMREYLAENSHYDVDETMFRYAGGHRLSAGRASEVAEAEAYAQGQLSPISETDAQTEFMDWVGGSARSPRDVRRMQRIFNLRTGAGGPLADASAAHSFLRHVERQYREAHADTTGWQIEIIGQMPAQIGMCAYDDRA